MIHIYSLILNQKTTVKILSQLPSISPMNGPQLVANIHIRRGLVKACLRRKVPGTHPLLKPRVILQSPQIHRPTLPFQMSLIPSSERVIHWTFVEGKQIICPLNHRARAQPRLEVKPGGVTKQNKHYSPWKTSKIYYPPKPQNFAERKFLDPLWTVIYQL